MIRVFAAPVVSLLAISLASGGVTEPAAIAERTRNPSLDTARATSVSDLHVDLGTAELRIRQGWLVPSAAIAGNPAEMVFVGEAHFYLEAPDAVEAQQLRLFTGNDALNALVDRAVLVLLNEEVASRLLTKGAGSSAPEPEVLDVASALFDEWAASTVRKSFNVELAIYADALGDSLARDYVLAWCHSEALGRFFFIYDPEQSEQVTVGQFVAMEVSDVEEGRIRREIRRGRRRGRYRDLRFEDLGDVDRWISAPVHDADGRVVRGGTGFEPDHYRLEVDLGDSDLRLSGIVKIDLTAGVAGRRTLPITLYPDVKVVSVKDGEGNSLPWQRSTWRTLVQLPEPTTTGQALTLVVEFAGNFLERLDGGEFYLPTTSLWYPHVGDVGRATYDATFRWPSRLDLMTGGNLLESGEDRGTRWEHRTIPVPTEGVSFEIGNYKVQTVEIEGVTLRVGILKTGERLAHGLFEQTVDAVEASFRLYEYLFGEFPLEEFTFVTGWRAASEAHLGFVVLDNELITRQRTAMLPTLGNLIQRQRLEIIAHEVAHQWWGHKVGVINYRDMWLGEALADFSVYLGYFGPLGRDPERRRVLAGRARSALSGTAGNGQPRESLGPIILGTRLNSSLDDFAYQSIVYDKGYLALSTVATEIGDDLFLQSLKSLSDAVNHRVIDTPTFLGALERMTGKDLQPFAQRFLYGTGVPTIIYDYEVVEDEEANAWIIKVHGHQSLVRHTSTELSRTEAEGWDAIKVYKDRLDLGNCRLTLPYEYSFNPSGKGQGGADDQRTLVVTGTTALEGSKLSFELQAPDEPLEFQLDPERRVLAFLYREGSSESTALTVRADQLASNGKTEEAIELLREAIDSERSAGGVESDRDDPDRGTATKIRDLYLRLAGLYLDEGRDDEAGAALQAAKQSVDRLDRGRFNWRQTVLETRLELRNGDYKSAYGTLQKHMRLPFLQRADESTADQMRRARFKDGIRGDGQTYAMLAIAAHYTGHEKICRRAADEAASLGANMAQLEGIHQE